MSDIKLFRYSSTTATELAGKAVAIEKILQNLIEAQMETFLGVRFLASEYGTGNKHRGRIDSLGLDENGCPVIIEKPVKLYVAYRRIKNFVCMSLISKVDPHIFLTLKLDPATVSLEQGFSRDVSNIGHWGTGDVEITMRTAADLEKAKPLIERAYTEN